MRPGDRIKKHLHDAFTVAHIDKNQTAQIATAVYPAAKRDLLTHMRQIELSAIFCTHNTILLTSPLHLTASGRVTCCDAVAKMAVIIMEKARQDKQIRAKAPISCVHLPPSLTIADNGVS